MAAQQDDFKELVSTIKETNVVSMKNDQELNVIMRDLSSNFHAQQTVQNLTALNLSNMDKLLGRMVSIDTDQFEQLRGTARNISNLVGSDLTNQLGTGQYDEQMKGALHEIEVAQDNQEALHPRIHQSLLTQIKESLKANQLSFAERMKRFFVNNIQVFGNLGDLTKRMFGANIFEQKRAETARKAEERGRLLQEENYDINYLAYKFMVTDQVA